MPSTSDHAHATFRRASRIVAAIAWAGLIFAASHRPDLRVSSDDLVDLVLRKAAHMLVFGVLLVLVARALRGEGAGVRAALVAAWVITFAYACSDEWHQTFIEGRAGQVSDVAIDLVGATIALSLLVVRWRDAPAPYEEPNP